MAVVDAASHSHSMLIYVTAAAAAEISFHVQVDSPICHADPSKQTQSERSCDETLAKIGGGGRCLGNRMAPNRDIVLSQVQCRRGPIMHSE